MNQRNRPSRVSLLCHYCLLCGDLCRDSCRNKRICSPCEHYLVKPQHTCQRCAIPLKDDALYCGECLKHPPDFDTTVSPYLYTAPLDQLINQFKHSGNHIIGKELSRLFCKAIKKHYTEQHIKMPKWVLPVPLHWRRQWQRGFNQAALLVDDVIQSDLCIHAQTELFKYAKKHQATSSQEVLSRKERQNNLKNAFTITKQIDGESIAIVDDVMTTGATVGSLARALKKAGAGHITVWALARTTKET